MTQPPLVTTPTYTVETPCVWTVVNTEPTRQPSQMTEPDGVKDTIRKEMLDGDTKANPLKPVDEMTAETILAYRLKDKVKAKKKQYYHGNKAPCQAYAKQYYHKNKDKSRKGAKAMPLTKEEQRRRQSPHASNRMKPLLSKPSLPLGVTNGLESNNKNNYVDLGRVLLF